MPLTSGDLFTLLVSKILNSELKHQNADSDIKCIHLFRIFTINFLCRCNLQGANGKIALGKTKLFSTILGKLFNMM